MKPENYHNEDLVLEAVMEARARQEAMEAIIAKRRETVERAWDAVGKLGGLNADDEQSITGSQRSKVVALEYRGHREVGQYAIVGKLFIEFRNRGEADESSKVRFKIGAAIAEEEMPQVSHRSLHDLGEGLTGETWHGNWEDGESTDDVEGALTQLGGSVPLSHDISVVRDEAISKLRRLDESIETMVGAAEDELLNPKPREMAAI